MNILIIENSSTLSQLIAKTLEAYKYIVTTDNESFVTKDLVKKNIFEVVILNSNLGNCKTDEILTFLRKYKSRIKILGVCNKGGWGEKVNFLNNGGDDVLTYPFPVQELIARIQSLMRRPQNYLENTISIGNITIDTDRRALYKNEKEVDLRKKEYDLFEYLVRNSGRPVSRCELLDHVWDYREYVGSNTIDVHINRLRDKLDDKEIIKSIHGIGYQIKKNPNPKSS